MAKSGGGKGLTIFALLLFLGIICGVWGYLIKTNKFFNMGEILRPTLKDMPILSLLLPAPQDESDPNQFSRDKLNEEYSKVILEKKQIIEEKETLSRELEEKKEIENKYKILQKEIDYLNKELEISKSKESDATKRQEQEENIQNLIKTYESMDAAEAAKILEQMGTLNINLVIKVCSKMKTSSFSAILQEMNTDFAAILSERMLEQG